MSKIALITGANRGIGLETARQLARDHSFTILLGAHDPERGTDAVNQLRGEGLDAHFCISTRPTRPRLKPPRFWWC